MNKTHEHVYETYEYDVFHLMMVFLSVSQCSFILATLLTSIHFKYFKGEEINSYNNIKAIDIYEDKYPIIKEPIDTQCEGEDEKQHINENSYVIEITPDGGVIMKYDYDEEGFVYWADNSISYTFLEVVARKFSRMFDNKHLYIVTESDNEEEEEVKEIETTDKQDDDLFFVSNQSHNKKQRKSTINIVRNKYVKKGKFSEFKFIQSHKNSSNKMTFQQYKELSSM